LARRHSATRFFPIRFALLIVLSAVFSSTLADKQTAGKKIYDYYCYQCHGYAGDGATLAANYLDPPPRNFTKTSPDILSRDQMTNAVTYGKPGTAMTSFGKTLSQQEIDGVITYIRASFMSGVKQEYRYHTEPNGWLDHERYRAAYPYVHGHMSIDTDESNLSEFELRGKRLFLSACISCHDPVTKAGGDHWELTGVSFPPGNYDEDDEPPVYELHERDPALTNATAQEARGEHLYQKHCSHCHAEDGTGRNWIGSFLTPHPPDFTDQEFKTHVNHQSLYNTIANGINGTSMPAWKSVLSDDDINATIAYVKRVFGPFIGQPMPAQNSHRLPPPPSWVKNDAID
jgi:cytochrome c oxidase cbb3-type subunit 3